MVMVIITMITTTMTMNMNGALSEVGDKENIVATNLSLLAPTSVTSFL